MPDENSDTPDREDGVASPASSDSDSEDETGPEMDRLPPPAFPPGSRRASISSAKLAVEGKSEGEEGTDVPEDAFISPDEPIRRQGRGIPDDAFISPDDPLVPKNRDEKGTVTGLGVEQADPAKMSSRRRDTPTIHELPYLLDQLAERIHESGMKALEVHAEMGHFQAALRSFLRGYLEGGRD